jgi:hypothetical protein
LRGGGIELRHLLAFEETRAGFLGEPASRLEQEAEGDADREREKKAHQEEAERPQSHAAEGGPPG